MRYTWLIGHFVAHGLAIVVRILCACKQTACEVGTHALHAIAKGLMMVLWEAIQPPFQPSATAPRVPATPSRCSQYVHAGKLLEEQDLFFPREKPQLSISEAAHPRGEAAHPWNKVLTDGPLAQLRRVLGLDKASSCCLDVFQAWDRLACMSSRDALQHKQQKADCPSQSSSGDGQKPKQNPPPRMKCIRSQCRHNLSLNDCFVRSESAMEAIVVCARSAF